MLSKNEAIVKIRIHGKLILAKKLAMEEKSHEMQPRKNPGKILDFNEFLITF